MGNITKCRVERKILVFFGSLLGIVNLGTKHTQETHTMNLSGDIGRKSGFSYESKRYFADDIRLVGATGERGALAVGMTGLMSLLDRMGSRYHTKEGERWRPTRLIP